MIFNSFKFVYPIIYKEFIITLAEENILHFSAPFEAEWQVHFNYFIRIVLHFHTIYEEFI